MDPHQNMYREDVESDEEISFHPRYLDNEGNPDGPPLRESGHGDAAHVGKKNHQIKVENYNGEIPWNEYIRVFNTIGRINKWSKEEKADFLFAHLRGPARQLACTLTDQELRNFDRLESILSQRFGPREQAELYLAELKGRRRKPKEGLRELGQAIRKLVYLAYPDMTAPQQERLAKIHFIDAIEDTEIRMQLYQGKPNNLQQAITLALEMEGYQQIESQRRGISKKYINAVETQIAEQETVARVAVLEEKLKELSHSDNRKLERRPKQPIECYYCHEKGHFRRDCPRRKNKYSSKQENELKPGL